MTFPEPVRRDDEASLVLRARDGDPGAFRVLVDRYDRRLLYFVLRFLRDSEDALDLMQDVWLTAFRRLGTLRAPEAFRVWLYQIARGRIIDRLRRLQREELAHEELRNGFVESADSHEDAVDRAEFVHHTLEKLTPEHREVLLLRFLEDMSVEEIAETLQCAVGTVKSRLHYARLALRREVERLTHE